LHFVRKSGNDIIVANGVKNTTQQVKN